jgi:hypothetical protein
MYLGLKHKYLSYLVCRRTARVPESCNRYLIFRVVEKSYIKIFISK